MSSERETKWSRTTTTVWTMTKFDPVSLETIERFQTSSVNAKKFQMVPEVRQLEEEGVINHKVQFSVVSGA